MPFNERTLKDGQLPACNRVSLSPFTRRVSEIEDPEGLRKSIEQGVRLVKKAKLGINFHRGLWLCKYFLGGIKTLARTDRIGATCMFSNVGNIQAHLGLPVSDGGTRCGPVTITDIDVIPALRIGTSFALTMHEFDSRLRLGIHYDSAWISKEQADDFFGLLKLRILDLADSSHTPSG